MKTIFPSAGPRFAFTTHSNSGTAYPMAVPEPGTFALVVPAALLWWVGCWRLRRRSGFPTAE